MNIFASDYDMTGKGMSQSDFLINNLICPTLLGTSKGQLGDLVDAH